MAWEAGKGQRRWRRAASSYSRRRGYSRQGQSASSRAQAHKRRRSCDRAAGFNRAAAPVAWRPVNCTRKRSRAGSVLSPSDAGGVCDRSGQDFAGAEGEGQRAEVTPRPRIETGQTQRERRLVCCSHSSPSITDQGHRPAIDAQARRQT